MKLLENVVSIYIVIAMLAIGLYMVCLQSKYLNTVDHLEKETKFVKVAGYGYIVLAIIGFVIYLK